MSEEASTFSIEDAAALLEGSFRYELRTTTTGRGDVVWSERERSDGEELTIVATGQFRPGHEIVTVWREGHDVSFTQDDALRLYERGNGKGSTEQFPASPFAPDPTD